MWDNAMRFFSRFYVTFYVTYMLELDKHIYWQKIFFVPPKTRVTAWQQSTVGKLNWTTVLSSLASRAAGRLEVNVSHTLRLQLRQEPEDCISGFPVNIYRKKLLLLSQRFLSVLPSRVFEYCVLSASKWLEFRISYVSLMTAWSTLISRGMSRVGYYWSRVL